MRFFQSAAKPTNSGNNQIVSQLAKSLISFLFLLSFSDIIPMPSICLAFHSLRIYSLVLYKLTSLVLHRLFEYKKEFLYAHLYTQTYMIISYSSIFVFLLLFLLLHMFILKILFNLCYNQSIHS